MSKWLDHLEALGVLEQTTQAPSSPALEPLPRNRRVVVLETQEPATALRQAILQARDWRDLEQILTQVQTAYDAGQLTQEEAEILAVVAAQEAGTLPEEADELRLSDSFREVPVRWVQSRVLGECSSSLMGPRCRQSLAQWSTTRPSCASWWAGPLRG